MSFVLAAVVTYIPYLGVPFKWLESFFHELSHALATLISGGVVSHIALFPNGAGLCYSAGGSPVLIGFAGYSGAALWGLLLYMMASSAKGIRLSFALLGVLVMLALLFFARDMLTIAILLVLGGLFFLPLKLAAAPWLTALLRFMAMIVLLNAIKSPTYLWGLDGQGDAELLSGLIWVPAFVWIGLWLAIASACLWCCWRISLRTYS
ncbi:M50 family metallopeptidase [Shewanella jiangmenensis]|uniref:M50 family metallopeptidase n=1 Tax=Shewanella jiangmenensis TaxID=2837387 RepID=UPI003D7D70C1